ncbi:MAG: GMC oxidoreductase [Hyphomicrobiaceae bacterium]
MVTAVKSVSELEQGYEAIVIGSGYGGGVAASRLARMGFRVAVLEQGRLWRLGDFPTTNKARRREVCLTGRAPRMGNPAGLYTLSVGKGMTVFGAVGVGGGSLINAGIALRPDLGWLRSKGWPEPLLADGLFAEGIRRGEAMFGVVPVPAPERFPKYRSLARIAEAAGKPIGQRPMTIAHTPGPNAAGVVQYACRHCGDCWSGCNMGAKTTTGNTYIADAVDHGATVFCKARARSIAKTGTGWEVVVEDTAGPSLTRRVVAPIVVLAAGTMGTNEILLRAQQTGLALSPKLGQRFSANGDDLVFAAELALPAHAIATGFPTQAPRDAATVGPHSIGLIDLADADGPLWLHDGTMLTLMAGLAPYKELIKGKLARGWRMLRGGPYGDEMSRVQILYIVGHDDATGRLSLYKDRVTVDWRGYSGSLERTRSEQKIRAHIERTGAKFHTNPFAMSAFGGNRIIAHPLGGCGMGTTSADGVIAHDGRVFDPSRGAEAVHEGLYVCDAAAFPSSVGVSPLLTITAFAERAMMLAADRLGRTLDVATVPAGRPLRDAAM